MISNYILLSGIDKLYGVIGNPVEYHGFILQRHISDTATVITYKAADGNIKRMAVMDAIFRDVCRFGSFDSIDMELQLFESYNSNNNEYIDGKGYIKNISMPDHVTNNLILDLWSKSQINDKTAHENCNFWMKHTNELKESLSTCGLRRTYTCVEWCRNTKLFDISCDLPNQYETLCIWACSDKLDEMDISLNNLPAYHILGLGYKYGYSSKSKRTQRIKENNEYCYSDFLCSCTPKYNGWMLHADWCGGPDGSDTSTTLSTAVPILELD